MPKNKDEWIRVLVIGNVILSGLLIIWGISVVSAPKFWFADAYAEKGERGDQGPEGEEGPRGPRGPVGPAGPDVDEALDGVADLDARVEDLEDLTDELETLTDVWSSNASQTDELAYNTCTALDDLMDTLEEGNYVIGAWIDCGSNVLYGE